MGGGGEPACTTPIGAITMATAALATTTLRRSEWDRDLMSTPSCMSTGPRVRNFPFEQ